MVRHNTGDDVTCNTHNTDNGVLSNFKIYHHNVQGLNIMKKSIVEILLEYDIKETHVICLTEHWCEQAEIECMKIQNFELVANYSRIGMQRGGSCIYVRSEIKAVEITKFNKLNVNKHFESCIIEISASKLIVICIYRTPDSDLNIFVRNMNVILDYFKSKNREVAIVGDLNIDFLKEVIDYRLNNLLTTFGIEAAVKEPTRITENTKTALDQILVNKDTIKCKVNVFDSGFPDHQAQLFSLTDLTERPSKPNIVYRENKYQYSRKHEAVTLTVSRNIISYSF